MNRKTKIGIVSNTSNCQPLLYFLKNNGFEIVLFSDDSNEKFALVEHYCQSVNITIEKNQDLIDWLKFQNPSMVFVFGYRKLIDVKSLPPVLTDKLFNIHFGSLPNYKGPTPVFWQIKNNEKEIGLCIHQINEKYDDGNVVWQKTIPNEEYLTYGFVELIFSQLILEGVGFVINILNSNKSLPVSSINEKPKYFFRPVLKDVIINWEEMDAQEIIQLIKACNPWNKGATTIYNGNEVKIIDAEIVTSHSPETSNTGTIIDTQNCLKILCKNGLALQINLLNINDLFLPGRHVEKLGFIKGTRFKSNL